MTGLPSGAECMLVVGHGSIHELISDCGPFVDARSGVAECLLK